jgi:hypothetical protein
MKMLLTLGLLALSFTTQAQPLASYQVIEPHPEEVKSILPYVKTRFREGRLWIVDLRSAATPAFVFKHLRRADPARLRHYTPGVKELSRFELPPINTAYLSAIKTDELKSTIVKLSSYKDRSAGSVENQNAQRWIAAQLEYLGYAVKTDCYQPTACSIIGEKKGTTKPEEVILVEGHFDSVGRDYAGADDNATGTASTLEIARVLKAYANKHTLRFFLTNGEELGLYGAEHYAKALETSGDIKNLKLVINMDMVGYNQNGIVELETDAEWNALAQWFAQLTAKYTTLKSKITLGAWGSDHVPFLQRGVPTLLTIEDWSTKTPCYHQGCDQPNTVNYNYATEITKLNTAAVLSKDAE